MQAECLASAYRLWKRQWQGPGREYCGGALVWQLNDCWPVTSWSIADFYQRPKHAYHAVKREMAPLTLGLTRKTHAVPRDKYTRAYIDTRTELEIWGSNLALQDVTADVVVKAFDVLTGEETYCKTLASAFLLRGNRSTEIAVLDVPVSKAGDEGRTVVAAYLYDAGKQLARYVNWPEPLKYVHLQKPEELRCVLARDGVSVELSAEVPVKGVAVECEDEEVVFGDNLVDLVPGEVVSIPVAAASEETVFGVRYLGMV